MKLCCGQRDVGKDGDGAGDLHFEYVKGRECVGSDQGPIEVVAGWIGKIDELDLC